MVQSYVKILSGAEIRIDRVVLDQQICDPFSINKRYIRNDLLEALGIGCAARVSVLHPHCYCLLKFSVGAVYSQVINREFSGTVFGPMVPVRVSVIY